MQQLKTVQGMTAASGKNVTFSTPVTIINIVADATIWVKVGKGDVPTAPSQIPTTGLSAGAIVDGWNKIKANQPFTYGVETPLTPEKPGGINDYFDWMQVWAVGAGDVVINAH